jgi:hypothetical protein
LAVGAVLLDWAVAPGLTRPSFLRLVVAAGAAFILSTWVIVTAALQLHAHSANIAWIEPLDLADFVSSMNLQLLLDSTVGSAVMLVLMAVGAARTFALRVTRLALFVLVLGVATLKAFDSVHPVISDFTLHWAASFTVLLASAALAPTQGPLTSVRRLAAPLATAVVLASFALFGPWSLEREAYISKPQDWQASIRRVHATPGSAMLVSHEAMGLIVQQACMLEYHGPTCPFPLIVMANSAQTDNWALGGYRGPIVGAFRVRRALGNARKVFAFSRYHYRPLDPFGLDKGDYEEMEWDDGELIGPIPVSAFDARPFSRRPVPDPPPDPD